MNAFRALKAKELLGGPPGVRHDHDLEAVGAPERQSGEDARVSYDGLPPWHEPSDGWILCADRPGLHALTLRSTVGSSVALALVPVGEGAQTVAPALIRGAWRRPPRDGDTISDPVVLWPLGEIDVSGTLVPAFELLYVDEIHPTPAQLAFAVLQGQASIVVHTYTRFFSQPSHRRRGGIAIGGGGTVYDGPPTIEYRWKSQLVTLRFVDEPPQGPAPTSAAGKAAPRERPRPEVHDRMTLNDGRVLWGRVESETPTKVVFVVVSGPIEQRMEFSHGDVYRVVGSPGTELEFAL